MTLRKVTRLDQGVVSRAWMLVVTLEIRGCVVLLWKWSSWSSWEKQCV